MLKHDNDDGFFRVIFRPKHEKFKTVCIHRLNFSLIQFAVDRNALRLIFRGTFDIVVSL